MPKSDDLEDRVVALEEQVSDLEERVSALEGNSQPPDPPSTPSDDATLQQLVDQGGAVTLPKADYTEFCTVNKPVQITGAPTTIDVTGLTLSNQKGIFDAQKDLEVADLILQGASVPDANGAAIRGAIGAAIVMRNCEITECQMGILVSGGGADITIEECHFHDNGTGGQGGLGHEIYCSAVNRATHGDTRFTITNSSIIGGPNTCIALKVRATEITVRSCEIRGSMSSAGNVAGRPVDFPDGGEVLIEECEIELRGSSPTGSILGYCTENTSQGVGTVTLRNVLIRDSRNRGGEFWARSGVGAKLVLEGCTYTAQSPPSLTGWASVQGAFTRA